MSSSVIAGVASSAFSSKTTHASAPSKSCPPPLLQRTNFHGLSLRDAKRVIFRNERKSYLSLVKRSGLHINARAAGASKTIEVEVEQPLGLTLGQKPYSGVVITWMGVEMQQKLDLRLGTRWFIPAASLVMSFGLQIS